MNKSLVPVTLKSPIILFLVAAVPLTLLLFINAGGYYFLSGEIKPNQSYKIIILFSLLLVTLCLPAVLAVVCHINRRSIPWILYWPVLFISTAYLFTFVFYIHYIFPPSLDTWIVSPFRILYFQFLFVIPLIFYSLVNLASFQLPLTPPRDILASLITVIIIPVSWYIGYNVSRALSSSIDSSTYLVIVLVMIASTLLLFLLLIRLILYVTVWLSEKGRILKTLFTVIISLLLPVCGLLLNITIQFPTDLQITAVYVLTIINGTAVSMPETPSVYTNKSFYLLRIAMYPFTLYFFLLFLPFLPLSIPAVIFFGTGFLVLTPTLLFLVHTRRIIEDFKSGSVTIKRTAASVTALLLIPTVFIAKSVFDKINLDYALNYVYQPDYVNNIEFKGNRLFLKHALKGMKKMKEGKHLPFISGLYNYIVFENLVLPDSKADSLSQVFFGEKLTIKDRDTFEFFEIFASTHANPAFNRAPVPFTHSETVLLEDIREVSSVKEDNFISKRIKLKMTATGVRLSDEFRTTIKVPEHVLVSDFSLYIQGEAVDGQLFEKKTALWVYQMITESRKDPALLYYHTKDELRLRVFPFNYDETRYCEIEFTYPVESRSVIQIGNRSYALNNTENGSLYAGKIPGEDIHALVISPEAKESLHSIKRSPRPYIRSKNGIKTLCGSEIQNVMNPAASEIELYLVNHDVIHIPEIGSAADINGLDLNNLRKKHPQRGGFALDRAVKHILLTHDKPYDGKVPINSPHFIIQYNSLLLEDIDFEYFHKLSPDSRFHAVTENRSGEYTFHGKFNHDKILYCGTTSGSTINGFITPDNKKTDIQYIPSTADIPAGNWRDIRSNKYMAGLAGMKMYADTIYFPHKTQQLYPKSVYASKGSGILNPSTSYIVVERDAQWKALSKKEKEKLRKNQNLEYTKSPEPDSVIFWAAAFFIILYKLFNRFKNNNCYK